MQIFGEGSSKFVESVYFSKDAHPIVVFNNVFKALMGILLRSAERFPGCLRVLIYCLMLTFREHYNSFHQGEKQPNTKLLLLEDLYVFIIQWEGGKRWGRVWEGERGGKNSLEL